MNVEHEVTYMDRLKALVALAVWDNNGRMYMPVWGRNGQIEAYASRDEAVEYFNCWVAEVS